MPDVAARGARPLVLKAGGSLAETGRLPQMLSIIASARVPVAVVPGGGPFADSIRALQPEMKFSEAVAHRLAMLGMHQMGELIAAHHPRFEIAQTLDDISERLARGRIPVWAPLRMIADDGTVPAVWGATSDTLAARLAELLGARLLLLKSVDIDAQASLEDLARDGVVDPVIASIVARGGLSWSIFGPSGDASLRAVLAGEGER